MGGGGKSEAKRVILIGRVVSETGRGNDSINVTFSRGRLERREAGRSSGEQPTIMCRRCTFDV